MYKIKIKRGKGSFRLFSTTKDQETANDGFLFCSYTVLKLLVGWQLFKECAESLPVYLCHYFK